MSPTLTERNPSERPVTKPEAVTELRAADCKTTRDWQRWARERREYADPYRYEGGRY
jgi:hypothetical protein